ncbi:MAG: class I SAM-dependent methyltransferase [bacterium]|nr:class I SAM-dependent methyltransferase [bacterium]
MSTNKKFFTSGFYEKYWGWEFEESEAKETAGRALELLGAKKGHILDWCGGWGRLGIHFARKGLQVTILDFHARYLEQARANFEKEGLQLETVCADCRKTPGNIQADFGACLFNTVGFFDDNEQLKAFESLYKALKPGAGLIVDCMNLLCIAADFHYRIESRKDDGTLYQQSNRFDFAGSKLVSDFHITNRKGKITAEKSFEQRLFTPKELVELVQKAGFQVDHLFGNFYRQAIGFDSHKIVLLAKKPR